MKKVLFVASVNKHIIGFHTPYLKMLKEKGYEVHVASYGDEKIDYCDKYFKVHFERSPLKSANIKAYKELKKIIEDNNYSMIHCHTPTASVLTRLAAKKSRKKHGTKVIYTAHGFHFFKGAPILNWVIYYPIEKILSRYTDMLITINKEDYEIAKAKFHCSVEYVAGVGVDEDKFNFEITENDRVRLRNEIGIGKEDFVIIYAARLDANKNQILLIKAIKELVKENPNIKLILPGQDELNGYYQNIVSALNLENNVIFLGYRSDIPQLLKIADMAASASIREGLGLNIIEAILSGLPVMATHNRGHNEIITDNINGMFCEFDHKDMAQKIIYIKENKKKFTRGNIDVFLKKNVERDMLKVYDECEGK